MNKSHTYLRHPKVESEYVHKIYSTIFKHFHKTRVYTWSWIREFIEYNLKNHSKEQNHSKDVIHMLDIGCGNGRNMIQTTQQNDKKIQWYGIDTCADLLNQCSSKSIIIQGDMTSIPLKNVSIDYSICIASFHHLSTVERRLKCLREIQRVTKYKCLLSVWSLHQPAKTKRIFNNYGDTYVKWTEPKTKQYFYRYYYIFRIEEFIDLCNQVEGLSVETHKWDCGNEIFILNCMN